MGGYGTTWQAAAAQISRMLILLATLQKIVRVPEGKFPQGNEHEPFKNEGSNSSPLRKKWYKKSRNHCSYGICSVPGQGRTAGPSLRSRPDTMKPSATQCKKILGNTRFFTVSNPIWYHAS